MTTLVIGEGNLAAATLSRKGYNAFMCDAKPTMPVEEEKKTNRNANHSGVNVSILCLSTDIPGEASLHLLFVLSSVVLLAS